VRLRRVAAQMFYVVSGVVVMTRNGDLVSCTCAANTAATVPPRCAFALQTGETAAELLLISCNRATHHVRFAADAIVARSGDGAGSTELSALPVASCPNVHCQTALGGAI
jgi:hypothetical protein